MIKSYKDLRIYQNSYKLALEIHKTVQNLPKEERYEISSQIKRAALSIPLNIAEGYGKKSSKRDFKRFLSIALGSCNETLVLIDFIKDLNYISEKEHREYIERYTRVGRQIYTLIEKWK